MVAASSTLGLKDGEKRWQPWLPVMNLRVEGGMSILWWPINPRVDGGVKKKAVALPT